ncbi:unnamed protein product [Dracunculus medinensis]|uniref:ANAPC4_WD40 domain-containing protein n=1 Tax=Dracunculus medinensis TaxID=318479 RepID=A0A0N4UEA3_DRAME|nr:unnamed protein product [Dracunculus medinensis]
MGVLIEEKIENDVTSTHHEMLAWHPRNDWLAIVSYNAQIGGQVHFFKHQIEKVNHKPVQKANCKVTKISWHPELILLLIGWENGDVTLRYADEEKDEYSITVDNGPLNKVTCLAWNSSLENEFCIADEVLFLFLLFLLFIIISLLFKSF